MRILRLTGLKIEPMTASAYTKGKDNNIKYFNVKHGSSEPGFHVYSCGVDTELGIPSSNADTYTFTGDTYTLRSYLKPDSKKPLKDKIGNQYYLIATDTTESTKKDMIVFWEIPNKNFIKCEYSLDGMVTEIGKGYLGKRRLNIEFKVPAPVLEVIGSCTLKWEAVTMDNVKYSQVINYDEGTEKWDIGIMRVVKGE